MPREPQCDRNATSPSTRPKTSAARASTVVVADVHDFAFAKMVAAAVGTELPDLGCRSWRIVRQQLLQPQRRAPVVSSWPTCAESSQRLAHSGGMPSCFAHAARRSFDEHSLAECPRSRRRDFGTFRWPRPAPVGVRSQMALISARRVGRSSIASAGRFELQQAHRALDVDADRARIDVRRRDQHAADRRTVAAVGVGIQHQIGHARREPRVDRLLQAQFVERAANRLGADDGDRLVLAAGRQDRGRFAGGDDLEFAGACSLCNAHVSSNSQGGDKD